MKPPSINKPRRGLTHSAVWLRRNVFDGILIRPISAEFQQNDKSGGNEE